MEVSEGAPALQISRLSAYLREFAPRNVLAPIGGAHGNGKAPLVKHAAPAVWNARALDSWRAVYPTHTQFAILLHDLCAIDVDNHAAAAALEHRFPGLLDANVPREKTRNGVHYLFSRSQLADADGFFDARSPVIAGVDFKTITSRGTRGVLAVAPSAGKTWITAPWDGMGRPPPIPDDVLRAVATPRWPAQALTFVCADNREVHCREARHLPRAPYISVFLTGDIDATAPEGGPECMRVLCTSFRTEAVQAAITAVECGAFDRSIDDATYAESVRFVDFVGASSDRTERARDDHEEWRAICRAYPAMARSLATAGLVDVASAAHDPAISVAARAPFAVDAWRLDFSGRKPVPQHSRIRTPRVLAHDPVAAFAAAVAPCVLDWMRACPGELVCAGGAVTGAACAYAPAGTDVDLFVVGTTIARAHEILDTIRGDARVRTGRFTGCAFTMVLAESDDVVQVVLSVHLDGAEGMLRGFDFSPARAAAWACADGTLGVYATPDWVECVRTRAFVVARGHWTDSAVLRIAKYSDVKGFDPFIAGLDRGEVTRRVDTLEDAQRGSRVRTALATPRSTARRAARDALARGVGLEALFALERYLARCVEPGSARGARYKSAMSIVPPMRLSDYLDRAMGFRCRGAPAMRNSSLFRAMLDSLVAWMGNKWRRVSVDRSRACWTTHEGSGSRAANALDEAFLPWRASSL